MKYKILAIIAMLVLSGCGTSTADEKEEQLGTPLLISTDSLTDQDDTAVIGGAFALMQLGEVNVIAVSHVGIDTHNARTQATSAISYYYGYPEIPLASMYDLASRTMPSNYSYPYPTLSEYYNGTTMDLREFEMDGLYDNQREDTVAMYCRVLPKYDNITILVLGQTYDISNFIKETSRCNGKEILQKHVNRIVIVGGRIDKTWDMNTGAHSPFHTYTAASTNLVYQTATELGIQIVNSSAYNYIYDPSILTGSVYQTANINSPMAFVYSTSYGSRVNIEDNYLSGDFVGLIYVARPQYFDLVTQGSATLNSHAEMTWDYNGQGSSDYTKMNISPAHMTSIINDIMAIEPTR